VTGSFSRTHFTQGVDRPPITAYCLYRDAMKRWDAVMLLWFEAALLGFVTAEWMLIQQSIKASRLGAPWFLTVPFPVLFPLMGIGLFVKGSRRRRLVTWQYGSFLMIGMAAFTAIRVYGDHWHWAWQAIFGVGWIICLGLLVLWYCRKIRLLDKDEGQQTDPAARERQMIAPE